MELVDLQLGGLVLGEEVVDHGCRNGRSHGLEAPEIDPLEELMHLQGGEVKLGAVLAGTEAVAGVELH